MSGPLRTLLIDIESQRGDDVPITVKVLKLANQRVMFPAFWCLKSKLQLSSLRDKRGTWRIIFSVHPDGVEVRHLKDQIVDDPQDSTREEGEFEIALVLKLLALPECDSLTDVHMAITKYTLVDDINAARLDYWRGRFERNRVIR